MLKSSDVEKQPSRGVLMKRCSENMQQIYRRTLMSKCDCKATLLKPHFDMGVHKFGSSSPDVSLGKGVLKICSKFIGEENTHAEVLFQ